mmetsp:Transcript_5306/g.13270  ORF Transcript_5306/g.13270 Transcript_5306/m.13270 type:complete len:206 (-) Transcript_5306:1883-2500(-)
MVTSIAMDTHRSMIITTRNHQRNTHPTITTIITLQKMIMMKYHLLIHILTNTMPQNATTHLIPTHMTTLIQNVMIQTAPTLPIHTPTITKIRRKTILALPVSFTPHLSPSTLNGYWSCSIDGLSQSKIHWTLVLQVLIMAKKICCLDNTKHSWVYYAQKAFAGCRLPNGLLPSLATTCGVTRLQCFGLMLVSTLALLPQVNGGGV